jgi:DNA-binding Lrp family transcriptional regulator
MKNELGVIKNIQPIFNTVKLADSKSLISLIFLKVNAAKSINFANKLSDISEVKCVYLTSGEHNMIIKLVIVAEEEEKNLCSLHKLEELVRNKIATINGFISADYQIVTKTIKDDQIYCNPKKQGIAWSIS